MVMPAVEHLEALRDLSDECQLRRGATERNALDELLFLLQRRQTECERRIAQVRTVKRRRERVMFRWLLREPAATAATIQERLREMRQQHQRVTAERDALSLAVESGDAAAGTRYHRLGVEAAQLTQRLQT